MRIFENKGWDQCRPERPVTGRYSCCVMPYGPPPDVPDLATYSQDEQLAIGATPTWASPDIEAQPLSRDVKVTVRNLSATASAINGFAELSSSGFGIGLRRTLDLTLRISLGPNEQTVLAFSSSWLVVPPPKDLQSQAGVHVRLIHPNDGKPINNNGSAMRADAYTSKEGRQYRLVFPVVNQEASAREISLSFLQNELNAVITPSTRTFAPLEQFLAAIDIKVPNALHGTTGAPIRKEATLLARGPDGNVIDGLTCVVWIDD